jgi:hypothetical protein
VSTGVVDDDDHYFSVSIQYEESTNISGINIFLDYPMHKQTCKMKIEEETSQKNLSIFTESEHRILMSQCEFLWDPTNRLETKD